MADDSKAKEAEAAESERRLARWAAIGIPSATILGALAVGAALSVGPAILVLLGGTLLGTIALLWASLRTLSGDAPLPIELEAMAIRTRRVDELAEKKVRVLRALKDLQHEHDVGKIDDKDYGTLGARFRDEAKAIMRDMDAEVDPMREKAEALAKEYLAKRGIEADAKKDAKTKKKDDDAEDETDEATDRLSCPKCSTSNEPDAAFCKKCGTSLKHEEADAPR